MKRYLLFAVLFPLCLDILAVEANSNSRPYQFGVFPFLPAEKLEKLWSPVTAELSAITGRKIKLRTRPSYSIFRNDLSSEIFDIVYMQPFAYVRTGSKYNYEPLARFVMVGDKENSGLLDAVVITHDDGKINSLQDLKGKVIAAPPKTAAVSLLGLSHLQQAGLKPGEDYQVFYYLNHISCLRQLVIRKVAACVTAHPPYVHFQSNSKVKLKILDRSKKIPSSMIAVHKRVKKADREQIKAYFLNLDKHQTGKTFLKQGGYRGFVETRDRDYDVVRQIWEGMDRR